MILAVAAAVNSNPLPAHAETPMTIYFGTTHTHTGAYNDHGADTSGPVEIFAAAKASRFNFVILTEHSGPTGPTDPVAYYAMAQAAAASATVDGKFIGLAGYEYSENSGDDDPHSGHLTGYGTDEFTDASAPGMNFSSFLSYLADQSVSRPVFGGFNHPPATGHAASALTDLTPAQMATVALSETSRNVGYNAADESAYYRGFVAELDRGWRVSPTCGLDGHSLYAVKQAETSTKKPCRTGVLAPGLTKDTLLAAIEARRTYATRDVNLRTKYSTSTGVWMGSVVGQPTAVTLNISASDPDTTNAADQIRRIEVIGNGGNVRAFKTFASHNVTWQPTINVGTDRYLFVRVFNGERSAHTAVLAPIWFQ